MPRAAPSRSGIEVLGAWTFTSLDELIEALQEVADEARVEGYKTDEVYCANKRRLSLVSEPLSDGSRVLNVMFWDGE